MKNLHEWLNTALIVVVGLLVLVGGNQFALGNTTASYWDASGGYRVGGNEVIDSSGNFTTANSGGTVTIGSSSNSNTVLTAGECHIQASSNTIAASSTVQVDCQGGTDGTQSALSDVLAWTSGDAVFLTPATTTNTTFMGVQVLGASASTTAGYFAVDLYNGTGGTFTWSYTASSSWSYLYIR